MTKQEAIELLEATRQKIAGQARLNACCVDARLLDKQRKLEKLIADWDAPVTLQDLLTEYKD